MEDETAKLLAELVKKSNFKTKEAVASIPSFSSFTTLIEMPIMSEVDMIKTMPFQIKQHIPLPIEEVAIDWIKIGEREDETGKKQQILFISIPKEIIIKYQNIFKLAGLKLKALEIEGLALIRSLVANDPTPTLIVDIGARSTNIIISDSGFLKLNNFTDFAGASLTQAIANGLGISTRRAEELKKQKGLKTGGADFELSTLPQPYLDVIIKELIGAKNRYENNYKRKIERVIISGGGANLIGITEYFENQIGIPTVIGNSFLQVNYPSSIQLVSRELGPELAVAIGLGVKNLS